MRMLPLLILLTVGFHGLCPTWADKPVEVDIPEPEGTEQKVFVLPIRENIMPPLTYLVRRGVKEAMAAGADWLILDMDTNGGRVDVTEEIIGILGQFEGHTATYVHTKAFSAGAFISVATEAIYMAPQSVIGAAAPIMMSPTGGAQDTPGTMDAKITSAISAMVRASAEKNGHDTRVVQAMIDKTAELEIDGHVINKKGNILTLTDTEAARTYGDPPKPLLSSGTVESLELMIERVAGPRTVITRIEPMGAEKLATWINAVSSILLLAGIAGIYIEFKTPGFGLFGILGILCMVIYFLGGYIAGLAGMEWLGFFVLGILLIVVELFVLPGTLLVGLVGTGVVLVAVIMAMVDVYPGGSMVPGWDQLDARLSELSFTFVAGIGLLWFLSRWLPSTPFYGRLVSESISAGATVEEVCRNAESRLGLEGISTTPLRPGGKARFGETLMDVTVRGEYQPAGTRVKIVDFVGFEAVVEVL